MEAITNFRGEYFFLSNFYPILMEVGGISYRTMEHYYQSNKATNLDDAKMVREQPTPSMAKIKGRHIKLREDWDEVKDFIMRQGLEAKFALSEMRSKLIYTGDVELIEKNNWGDSYWGISFGHGQNKLGKMLMEIRGNCR